LALSKLNQIESPNYFESKINQIEYWYRLARVESRLNNSNKVIIAHYKKVLEEGQNISSYYAPMSALQIGLIYEKIDAFEHAEFYLDICLAMSGFDYERGIHQQAKASLDRMSD